VNRHRPPGERGRRFIELCALELGWGGIDWRVEGLGEIRARADSGAKVCASTTRLFRPAEVETLLAIRTKAGPRKSWVGRPPPPWRSWWRRWLKADRQDAPKGSHAPPVKVSRWWSMEIHRFCCGS